MYLLNDVGRGMKNGENFSLLYDLADKLNAAGIYIHVRPKGLLLNSVVVSCMYTSDWILLSHPL